MSDQDKYWPFVVPNFEELPPVMQDFIKVNLKSLADAARKWSEDNGMLGRGDDEPNAMLSDPPPHHLGIVAGGHAYHVTGNDQWNAVRGDQRSFTQGGHQHVTGGRLLQEVGQGISEDQFQEHAVSHSLDVYGNSVNSVAWNAYQRLELGSYAVIGPGKDESGTPLARLQSVRGDDQALVEGSSIHQVQGQEARHIGDPDAPAVNPQVVTDHVHHGSHSQVIRGNQFVTTNGSLCLTVGYQGESLPYPEPVLEIVQDSVPAGAGQQPSGTTALGASAPPLQDQLIQQADPKMAWTKPIRHGGQVPDAMKSSILGESPSPQGPAYQLSVQGKMETSTDAQSNSTTGESTESTGSKTESHGSFTSTTSGIHTETVMGLEMTTLLGLSMPFETATMPFALLEMRQAVMGMDASMLEVASKAMWIINEGGTDEEQAAEATDDAAKQSAAKAGKADILKDADEDIAKANKDLATAKDDAATAKTAATDSRQAATEARTAANTAKTQAADAAKAATDAEKDLADAQKNAADLADQSREADKAAEAAAKDLEKDPTNAAKQLKAEQTQELARGTGERSAAADQEVVERQAALDQANKAASNKSVIADLSDKDAVVKEADATSKEEASKAADEVVKSKQADVDKAVADKTAKENYLQNVDHQSEEANKESIAKNMKWDAAKESHPYTKNWSGAYAKQAAVRTPGAAGAVSHPFVHGESEGEGGEGSGSEGSGESGGGEGTSGTTGEGSSGGGESA